jgi:hypothetical protein
VLLSPLFGVYGLGFGVEHVVQVLLSPLFGVYGLGLGVEHVVQVLLSPLFRNSCQWCIISVCGSVGMRRRDGWNVAALATTPAHDAGLDLIWTNPRESNRQSAASFL